MHEVGSFYSIGSIVYVFVNKQGTVEKSKPQKWWRILWLAILQTFGKCTTLPEVRIYLK
jgi:hypothetical protein